jgi:hypothetical protein
MSPIYAGRSTDASTLAHLSGPPSRQTPGGGNTSVLDNALIEEALTEDPNPPRPVAPTRVDQTPSAGPYSYSDPSMYLG